MLESPHIHKGKEVNPNFMATKAKRKTTMTTSRTSATKGTKAAPRKAKKK